MEPGSLIRRTLVEKAVTAGTPACLVAGVKLLERHRTLDNSLDTYVDTCKFGWELGQRTLSELQEKVAANKTKGK
ncbi:hypothetical protein EON65_50270 [archaeon]|nr:MAG: hypothetical protein EON65_50270 [archaeon]